MRKYLAVATLLFTVTGLAGWTPAQAQQPDFSKLFTPDTIGPGATTVLQFTIDASALGTPVTDLAFTDNLPAAVTIAGAPNVSTDCGGTVTAPGGGGVITFTGDGASGVGAGQTCTVSVNVTSAVPGTHMNVSGDLTSSAGNSGPATDDLIVNTARPGFSKAFAPATTTFGETVRLTFTIDNTANAGPIAAVGFTDNLPTGMTVGTPTNVANDCGGTVTAAAGSGTISLAGGLVPAATACTVEVDIVAGAIGVLGNVTGTLTAIDQFSNDASSGSASAELTVSALAPGAPTLTKFFLLDPVAPGATVDLRFIIFNPDRDFDATAIAFTDVLDANLAGLAVSGALPTDPCGKGSTISGTSTLTFSGGSLAPGSSCQFTVPLLVPGAAAAGGYTNTTTDITATVNGGGVNGGTVSDDLVVSTTLAPLLTKTFINDPVGAGGTETLRFTITNQSTVNAATGIAFSDVLSDMTGGNCFTPNVLPTNGVDCGAGSLFSDVTFNPLPPGDASLTFFVSGITLAASASCTFDLVLDVADGTASGTYTNTTSAITATVGGAVTGAAASDSVTVVGASIQFTKEFTDDPVAPGGTATLEFTIDYDAINAADATAIAFTDDLNAMLAGAAAAGLPANDICGAGSSLTGGGTITLAGGTLAPGASCTFTVPVSVPGTATPGAHTNTTSAIAFTSGGVAVTGLAASGDLNVVGMTLAKEFIDDPVIAVDTATLRFTIQNQTAGDDATAINFTDNLDSTIDTMTALGPLPTPSCGGTVSTANAGQLLIYTGRAVNAGASCSFDVTVQVPGTAAVGSHTNTTSLLTATIAGVTPTFDAASDSIVVETSAADLAFSKSFTDSPAAPGDTATLEFTITNAGVGGAKDAAAIGFTEDLDAMLTGAVATGLPATDVCGAGSTLGGAGTITLAGASVPAGTSCIFTVPVSIPGGDSPGTYTNTTSTLAATVNGTADTVTAASANLSITSSTASFAKSFTDDPVIPGDTVSPEYTIGNTGAGTLGDLRFADDLGATLTGLAATGLPQSNVCAGSGSLSGTDTVTLAGATLTAGQSCTFTVTLAVPAGATPSNYPSTSGNLLNGADVLSGGAMDALVVIPPANLAVTPATDFSPVGIEGGPFAPATATYTLENTGGVSLDFTASANQAFFQVMPTTGSLAAGATTTVTVSLTALADGLANGSYFGISSFINDTNGAGGGTRNVNLTVQEPASLAVTPATDLTASGLVGGPFSPTSETYTLTNNGDVSVNFTAVRDQAFFDVKPASGTIAAGATTTVTVAFNATAAVLTAGSHIGTVAFTNTTNGNGDTMRGVDLTILDPASLSVSPGTDLVTSGLVGGPFSPTSETYTLTNGGDVPLAFTAVRDQAFFNVTPASGTIAAGATATVVVALNAGANVLAAGIHAGMVTFTNANNGNGDTTRNVDLTVLVPSSLVTTPTPGLTSSGLPGGPFTPGRRPTRSKTRAACRWASPLSATRPSST